MESIKGLPGATLEALMRDWTLWVAILSITLVFMIYLYLFPKAMEFFADYPKEGTHKTKATGPGKNTTQQ
jgi:hypothetical protein